MLTLLRDTGASQGMLKVPLYPVVSPLSLCSSRHHTKARETKAKEGDKLGTTAGPLVQSQVPVNAL